MKTFTLAGLIFLVDFFFFFLMELLSNVFILRILFDFSLYHFFTVRASLFTARRCFLSVHFFLDDETLSIRLKIGLTVSTILFVAPLNPTPRRIQR